MSKFFFDGKANNNNERGKKRVGGDRVLKMGTKKSPAQLSVQTEERKTKIEALLADNQWFADIVIDKNVPENIKDLEFLQNNQVISVTTKKAGRNDPCPCGSGKKFKKCCG